MPATIVHAYFAQDVYDILPEYIKDRLSPSRIRMFGQGTDPLMFYNLTNVLPGRRVRRYQKYFHRNKTREYFINLIEFMKSHKYYNDKDACSFLVGFICHYILDSTVHPFIIYKTGYFDKHKPNTYKYNNIHAFMETFLDNDMIRRREHTNPYYFKTKNFCFDTYKFSYPLNNSINYSFKKTFDWGNMPVIYYKALKQMRSDLSLYRRDPIGIKKFFYKLIDTFTSRRTFRFEAISYYYPLEDRHNFLNNNHTEWHNPVDYTITSNDSFLDLYLKALKVAKKMVEEIFKYFNDEDIDLNKVITNNSYVTGLDCDEKKEPKYFEF